MSKEIKNIVDGDWELAPRVNSYSCNPTEKEKQLMDKHNVNIDFEAFSIGSNYGQVCFIPMDESSMETAILLGNAKSMVFDLIYFCKRVEKGTIRSKTTYDRYRQRLLNTLPHLTWEEIMELGE